MSKYKDKKPSMIEFTRKYANNDQACEDFFFRASILMATTAKNVAVLTTGRFLHAIMCIPVLNAVISHVCLQEQSFRIANWVCISCCLACLSSSLPTKVSVQWRCVLSWM